MAWVKLDDRYAATRKIKKAWRRDRASVGLHVQAMAESALQETDGLVELDWLEEMLPDEAEREATLKVMLDLVMLEELPAGEKLTIKATRVKRGKQVEIKVTHGPLDELAYVVHDYLEFNEARQEADERRRSDAERKTKERRKSPGESPDDSSALSDGSPNGHGADSG